jgi:hypothetical protein
MSPDGTYNGYQNYQTWNVCLWISNNESLNNFARGCFNYAEFVLGMREDGCLETPDMVAWNDSGINMAEMVEYWEENFSKVVS